MFGTVDFQPIEQLTLTAGFNYTRDRKKVMIYGERLHGSPTGVLSGLECAAPPRLDIEHEQR